MNIKNQISRVLIKVKNKIDYILGFIPSKLPVGMQEFEKWYASIIRVYDLPDNDSFKFALASMVMHSGPTAFYQSKFKFSLLIRTGMAKQVAGAVFQEVKEAQKKRELEQKQKTEATVALLGAGSEIQQ